MVNLDFPELENIFLSIGMKKNIPRITRDFKF